MGLKCGEAEKDKIILYLISIDCKNRGLKWNPRALAPQLINELLNPKYNFMTNFGNTNGHHNK